MTARLMMGKDTAAAVKVDLDRDIADLKERGIMPRLDIIRQAASLRIWRMRTAPERDSRSSG